MTNQTSTAAATAATDNAPTQSAPPPEAILTQIAFGALTTQALYVVAKLGIPDLLAAKPQTVRDLAAQTKTNERALYRIMRSLTGLGVFEETDPKVFALAPLGQPLRSDAPNSMRNGAIFMGEEWHWRVWGNLLYSVETGKPAWSHVHGVEVFDYFAKNPQSAEVFNRAMTDMSVGIAPVIVEAYDFSGMNLVVDIAGGHGYMLSQVVKATPNIKGILFDVPPVIAGAGALLEEEGVSERIEKVAGDFFASVPKGADAYMMKSIIHDWDDEHATKILQNINRAMNADSKVLIIEAVVPESSEAHYSKLLDLEMLVSPGGVERTATEFRELLAAANLKLARIIQTKSPISIIEAVKA